VPAPGAHAIVARLPLAVAAAGAAAVAARAARALTLGGAVAAAGVGVACAAAGWDWGFLLIAFFLASTGLSRLGQRRKEKLAAGVVSKGGERDAVQVLANGGAFAASAIGHTLLPSPAWYAIGAGALAAATADTWATEVGMLIGGIPRSIRSWHPVAPGTSGGITVVGTLAAMAGSVFIGLVARAAGWPTVALWAALLGGMVGATADSVLGATVQARRWCDRCNGATERAVHSCGATTVHAGGLAWLDNDRVNAVASAVGAVAGSVVAWTAGRTVS
jgi:uncharacterized protein (TIGR00297 family)